ncbi:flocculation-associated PEP-CTERM protein PepA [Salinimonas marina]|uniref:Flocculation-associated PEP-CTERM protein PepA n=1 Tax=Salinimonas marina TaxID=2785918 RepID=A0A7S9DYQ0_9ALTE|nr:flocculation-associated PEP-CTERM protein PepA [Salinimonas marina]QPG06433.1 flocculation-associated PEP-CTERM protein PepA [Salinimonas marina]
MKLTALVKPFALSTALVASFACHAGFMDFNIDETRFDGGQVVTADKLNGGYTETLMFDGEGNFSAQAAVTFAQLFGSDGTQNSSQIGSVIGSEYKLYALFSATGTVSVPGEQGSNSSLTGAEGSFSLFLDQDNNFGVNIADDDPINFTTVGTAGDLLLGTSNMLMENYGLQYEWGGVFDFTWGDFTLTADGQSFFVAPNPFYNFVIADGDFDTFAVTGSQRVTGDVSAVFVPEPSTLAVLALGLLGLGATSRRKS